MVLVQNHVFSIVHTPLVNNVDLAVIFVPTYLRCSQWLKRVNEGDVVPAQIARLLFGSVAGWFVLPCHRCGNRDWVESLQITPRSVQMRNMDPLHFLRLLPIARERSPDAERHGASFECTSWPI